MKKIAVILLLVFGVVQAGPVVRAIFSDTTSIFLADEEKCQDSANKAEKQEKKDYSLFFNHLQALTHDLQTAFILVEKIHPSPCLEKLTPPPNHC
ncbi:MAG: hypothetical protein U0U70_02205 [Chitinophagaceae bacterium]